MTEAATKEAVATFIAALYEPGDLVEVRCLREGSKPWRRWVPADFLVDLVPELRRLNGDGWNVYVGANPRTRDGGGSDEDVALARTVFVDFDDARPPQAAARIEAAGLPTPTLVLDSGNGAHAYWRLEEPLEDLETWADYQRAAIAAVGSDPTIKNPSRIMRVPGFENLKPEKDATLAQVFAYVEDEPHALEDLGLVPLPAPKPGEDGIAADVGERSEPHPIVLEFIRSGRTGKWHPDGRPDGRREAIFTAACELAARGWPIDEAAALVEQGAARSSFADLGYVRSAVRSAYGKPREPMLHAGDIDDDFIILRDLGPAAKDYLPDAAPRRPSTASEPKAAEESAEDAPAPEAATTPQDDDGTGARPRVANAVERWVPGKKRPIRVALDLEPIVRQIKSVLGGWPKSMGGLLFEYAPLEEGGIPDGRDLRFYGNLDALFARLHETASVWFLTGTGAVDRENRPTSLVTRGEVLEALRQWRTADHLFSSIELLPHEPPVPGVWYAPIDLPEADGKTLEEFLAAFNPRTELDRKKILAAILTVLWGGPPGKRPAFVFTSPEGRGAGKTSSARAIAALAGGGITMHEGEDSTVFLQRLFSDDALGSRVAVIDNVKRSLDSATIEAFITAPMIEGKRLYHGGVKRPNLLTWFVTANTPSLSRDLAERSVIIELGRPNYAGRDFDAWVIDFLRRKRAALIADILAVLRGPVVCDVSAAGADRWALWQREVLGRIEGGDEVAAAAKADRKAVDADSGIAEEIADTLDALVRYAGHDPAKVVARIPKSLVADAMRWEGLVQRGSHTRKVTDWLRHQLDVPPLRGRLEEDPSRKGGVRSWVWAGENVGADATRASVAADLLDEAEWRDRRAFDQRSEGGTEGGRSGGEGDVVDPPGDVDGIPI